MYKELLEYLGIQVVSGTNESEELICKCPLHKDDKPSFSFNTKKLVWNCFVCGGGSLRDLVKRLGYDYNDIVKQFGNLTNQSNTFNKNRKKTNVNYILNSLDLTPIMNNLYNHNKLINRLSKSTISKFKLKYSKAYNALYIPAYLDNKLVSFQLRNISDTGLRYFNVKKNMVKTSNILFNYDSIIGNLVVILEGAFDVMKLVESGFNQAVSTFGAGLKKRQVDLLFNKKIINLYLMYDNDRPGKDIMNKDYNRYLKYFNIKKIYLNQFTNKKDVCDMSNDERRELVKYLNGIIK